MLHLVRAPWFDDDGSGAVDGLHGNGDGARRPMGNPECNTSVWKLADPGIRAE